MLSAEILLVYFLILSHLYSTVERCKLIRISYLKDDSYEVDQLVTYSCKELILSMRLFLLDSVGICMCGRGLNLKQLSGFSFLNSVYLLKLNVAQW